MNESVETSSVATASVNNNAATTPTTTTTSSSPPTVSAQKTSSTSPTPNGKVKALAQQQQQQQQQQHHQFRAPQQFVKQRKSTNSTLSKKNKTWNKRQNKIGKQQQQQQQQHQQLQQQHQQLQTHSTATFTVGNNTNITNALNANTNAGESGEGGGGGGGSVASKADLENIQNVKNQLANTGVASGGSGSYYHAHQPHHHHQHYSHGHHGHYGGAGHRLAGNSGSLVGNITAACGPECRSTSSVGGNAGNGGGSNAVVGGGGGIGNLHAPPTLEKLCYNHGYHHLNKQLYKKVVAHRGHYHNHVLCAGAAHNSHGGVNANSGVCCLLHNCPTQNGGKDKDGNGSHISSNSSVVGLSTCSALHYCCGRAKFFLPDKRLRKEIIVPPTKFLLGGNISDPLNLNSLQNETASNNNTPATTPRRSPITTPPKVEVIIPPNIHDPLHLLDPVDSMEYEKQLTSPLKHHLRGQMLLNKPYKPGRNRKNRKRRRHDSYGSGSICSDTVQQHDTGGGQLTTTESTISSSLSISTETLTNVSVALAATTTAVNEEQKIEWSASALSIESVSAENSLLNQPNAAQQQTLTTLENQQNLATLSNAEYTGPVTRERANRDLRLELNSNSTTNSTCGSITGMSTLSSSGGGGGSISCRGGRGRKRKISESNNSSKNKKHRDSLDKIVSPVVPQPGAWKRPPRQAASGARKPNRRSTSVSESELLSPADELRLWPGDEGRNVITPDQNKLDTISETGLGSPQSTVSGSTSIATAEQELPFDATAESEGSSAVDGTQKQTTQDSATAEATAEITKSTAQTSTITTTAAAVAATTTTSTTTPQTTTKDSSQLPKYRADSEKYRFGNYDRYKGVRQLNEFIDVRLHIFSRNADLFHNKDILDIGCNTGQMTISVARDLAPKSIVGIDIDKELIKRARRNLAMYVRIPPEPAVVVKTEIEEATPTTTTTTTAIKEEIKTEIKVVVNSTATTTKAIESKISIIESTQSQLPLMKKHKNRKSKKQRLAAAARQAARQPATAAHLMHHHHLLHHHHHHDFHHLNNNWHPEHQHHKRLHINANELFPISFPLSFGGLDKFGLSTLTPPPSSMCSDTKSPASRSTPGHPANAILNSTCPANDFPQNVYFRQMNYILKDESHISNDTQQYDLILCLSVTKWIHLNFGDAGLKQAFKRMFNQLRPGGKLILEAQNWASYKKKSNLTAQIHKNYQTIEFFPNKFHEYLLSSEVGFSHSYTLGVPRHLNKGFGRPIQLYAKGDYTPNHIRWSDAYYPNTPFEEYRGIYAFMPPRSSAYAWNYAKSSTRSQTYETPHHASGPYSCRQTPVYHPTYNPLETDSYQPSYDMEYMNHADVFGSPLYQTVWSPPASLRNSSSHTPAYGSVREAEIDGDGGGQVRRHVYPPNDDTFSPNANAGGAFNSIRDPDTDDSAGNVRHVYATNCGESSSSPQVLRPESEINDDPLILDDDAINGSNSNAGGNFVNEP